MSGDKALDRSRDKACGSHPWAEGDRSWSHLRPGKLTSARSRKAGSPQPLRVLLAEDDLPNVLLANAVMELLGCQVTTVGARDEAVSAVKQEPFDIVGG